MVKLNDGTVDMVFQAGWSRWRALRYALKFEDGDGMFEKSGKIIPGLGIWYYKLKQWRLEPDTQFLYREGLKQEQRFGWIDIDGEKYETETC